MKIERIWIVKLVLLAIIVVGCSHQPAVSRQPSNIASNAASIAKKMVGTHYRFGGNNPAKGFDCSGLVQYSYRRAGASVPRSTQQQRKTSRWVSSSKLEKGDLLFFNQLGKRSSHVGIYIGNKKFVHAPSSGKRVRIDSLQTPYWKRHLASARRFERL